MRLAERKRRVGSTVRVRPFRCILPGYLTTSIDVSSILSAPLASSPYSKDPFSAPGVPASGAPL
jgi:hypothetical protein